MNSNRITNPNNKIIMSKFFLLFILSLIITSCSNYGKSIEEANKTNKLDEINNSSLEEKINKSDNIVDSRLLGIWKIPGEENSVFEIIKDSIYYTDFGKTFFYKLKNDSIVIYYDGFIDSSIYDVYDDILIFKGAKKIDTFERFIN
jgi:hypothetical protein